MSEIIGGVVYEIILHGEIQSVQTVNVFHYAGPVSPLDVGNVLDSFIAIVPPAIVSVMHSSSQFTGAIINGIRGDTRFAVRTFNTVGTVSGEGLPPYCSWDFTLVRGSVHERNGYKRFGGIPESQQAFGFPSGGTILGLNVAAAALLQNLNETILEYNPCIQRKHIQHVTQNPPRFFDVSAVQFSKIGTQNSRKFGHGR